MYVWFGPTLHMCRPAHVCVVYACAGRNELAIVCVSMYVYACACACACLCACASVCVRVCVSYISHTHISHVCTHAYLPCLHTYISHTHIYHAMSAHIHFTHAHLPCLHTYISHTHIYHVCTQLLRGHSGKRCNLVSLFHDPKQILKSGLYKNGGFVISCVDLNIYSRVERTVSLHRISPEPYICTVYNPMCGDFPAKNAVCTPYIGWPEPYIYTVYDRIFGDFYAKNTVCTLCIPIHVWFWPGMGHADF
jgi:hypothetical protein